MERPCSVMLSDEMISCDDEDIADENLEVEDILLEEDQIQSMLTGEGCVGYLSGRDIYILRKKHLARYFEDLQFRRSRIFL